MGDRSLKELWTGAGVGNSTRHIPLHTLVEKMDPEICKVILPLHHLTGCDSSSKFGTKAAGLKQTLPNIYKNLERIQLILTLRELNSTL